MSARGVSGFFGYLFLACAVAVIAGVFYLGGFKRILSTESSSFQVESLVTQAHVHHNAMVAVIGNSTAAEGFRANDFNAKAGGAIAVNLGVPSGHLFLFEKIFQIVQTEGLRPKIVVLMVTPETLSLRQDFDFLQNDLSLLKTELEASDFVRLAAHTSNPLRYSDYAARIAVRPVLFRAELRDIFLHPRERMENAARVQKYLAGFNEQSPMIETQNEYSVCAAGTLDHLASTIETLRQRGETAHLADLERIRAGYVARVHQPLAVDSFETKRFERILRIFAASGAKVYIVEAPYYDPQFEQYPAEYRTAVADAIRHGAARVPGVAVLPPFQADCNLMLDTVHLNHKGGEQFTEYVRTRVL
jgi:hypothetical protein